MPVPPDTPRTIVTIPVPAAPRRLGAADQVTVKTAPYPAFRRC